MRPRFTIAALVALVALCGVGFAALRNANDVWASFLFTLTLFVLGVASLGGVFRRGPSQAFLVGFASFGIAYLCLWGSDSIRPHLATTKLLELAGHKMSHSEQLYSLTKLLERAGHKMSRSEQLYSLLVEGKESGLKDFDSDGQVDVFVANGTTLTKMSDFLRVGHSLFALIAALTGGLAARWFHATRTEASP